MSSYLEGAGIVAWRPRQGAGGYEPVAIPQARRVTRLDDLSHRVAAEIRDTAPHGRAPEPQIPMARAIDTERLEPDENVD